jgi:hypothetical protein
MFNADDIQSRVRQRPFVPVRIVTSSGQIYDVYHPDLVMVGRRDLMIGRPSTENPAHYDQVSRVAILHVTDLQDLPTPAAPGGSNGAAD